MPRVTQLGAIPARSIYTKKYDTFRGVDFSADMTQIDPSRSPDAPNLISGMDGAPEKRVGWRILSTIAGACVYGIFKFKETYLIHAGAKLYTWDGVGTPAEAYSGVREVRSFAKPFKDYLIFLDGGRMLLFDGESCSLPEDKAYIPTTSIGRVPGDTPGGAAYQEINLLTRVRKNSFSVPAGTASQTLLCDAPADNSAVYLRFIDRPKEYIFKWEAGDTVRGTNYQGRTLSGSSTGTLTRGDVCKAVIKFSTSGNDDTQYPYIPGADNMVLEYSRTVQALKFKKETFALVNNTSLQTFTLEHIVGPAEVFVRFLDKADTFFMRWTSTGTSRTKGYNYQGAEISSYTTGTLTRDSAGRGKVEIAVDNADKTFPYTAGTQNISIEYYYTETEAPGERINKCTFCETFENRMFYSGNPNFKNTDWHSGVNDPLYVPDLSYTEIGSDDTAIAGYLKAGQALAVIKKDGAQERTIFMRSSTVTADGEMIFPVLQGIPGIGGISCSAMQNFLDDPVFLSSSGLYAIGHNDITAERILHPRSTRVNPRLTRESALSDAVMTTWDGYLLIAVGGNVYIADGRQKTYAHNLTNTYEYEWYLWDNVPASCLFADGDILFFGTSDGKLCRFNNDMFDKNGDISMLAYNDNGEAIKARWATKLDDDGDFMSYKTMIKKGSGVFLKAYTHSGVDVYIRTEADFGTKVREVGAGIFTFDDMDFEHFSFNTTPYSMAPFNAKIKKYKAIQVICKNETPNQGFGIYSVIRRYVTGNFVK